jgi:beta-barrel assembly-enhancing protease
MRRARSLPILACFFTLPLLIPAQDKKKDPDQIGNRDVDKGINLYSIPKEMALGKALATEVIRNNRVVDDP